MLTANIVLSLLAILGTSTTPIYTHILFRNSLLKDNFDSLDSVLAQDLGHFNNPNAFTHPLGIAVLKENIDCLDTFLL